MSAFATEDTAINTPAETGALFKQKNIRRVKLYSPDHDVLAALRGSDIEVMLLGLPNPDLQRVASSQSAEADKWVQTNVISYVHDVKFRYVSVGNEVKIADSYSHFLVPAMQNIDRAVVRAGLHVRSYSGIVKTHICISIFVFVCFYFSQWVSFFSVFSFAINSWVRKNWYFLANFFKDN